MKIGKLFDNMQIKYILLENFKKIQKEVVAEYSTHDDSISTLLSIFRIGTFYVSFHFYLCLKQIHALLSINV